eukprot:s2095_g25.t1
MTLDDIQEMLKILIVLAPGDACSPWGMPCGHSGLHPQLARNLKIGVAPRSRSGRSSYSLLFSPSCGSGAMFAKCGARAVIIDQGADESQLLGVVQELEVLREVGVHQVPLIFLLVQGSAARDDRDRDDLADLDRIGCIGGAASASVDMTRAILSMPQPIYGLALGEISSTGAMILDACDCILSDLPHENLVSRVLHPNEIAVVCEILSMEVANMNSTEVEKVKERLHFKKLSSRFPALARARCPQGCLQPDTDIFAILDQVKFLPGQRIVIDI